MAAQAAAAWLPTHPEGLVNRRCSLVSGRSLQHLMLYGVHIGLEHLGKPSLAVRDLRIDLHPNGGLNRGCRPPWEGAALSRRRHCGCSSSRPARSASSSPAATRGGHRDLSRRRRRASRPSRGFGHDRRWLGRTHRGLGPRHRRPRSLRRLDRERHLFATQCRTAPETVMNPDRDQGCSPTSVQGGSLGNKD